MLSRRLWLVAGLIASGTIEGCESAPDEEPNTPAVADALPIQRKPIEPWTTEVVLDAKRGYPSSPIVETTEQLRIGAISGAPEVEFHQLRTIAVDDAGFIYVGNDRAGEVRAFSPKGAFVRKIGRYGEGPGEFRSIRTMFFQGDVLVVEDGTSGRVNRIARDGTFIGSFSMSPYGMGLSPRGASPEGYVLRIYRTDGRETRPSVYRIPISLAYVPGTDEYDGAAVDLRNPPSVVEWAERRKFDIGTSSASPLWEPIPQVAIDGAARIHAHTGDVYVIDTFDHTGRLVRRVTSEHTPRPIDRALLQEYANRSTARIKKDPSTAAELEDAAFAPGRITGRAKLPTPDHLPVLGRLLVSRRGTLWVERPDLVDDPVTLEVGSGSSRWDVITERGELIGTVEFPASFAPMVAMDRAMIGVSKDELGVEYVVRMGFVP